MGSGRNLEGGFFTGDPEGYVKKGFGKGHLSQLGPRWEPGGATSAPHTRPMQRLSRPPPIQKIGAENHMLQLNI